MKKSIEKLNSQINTLALDTVMQDPEDIPGLGEVLKTMESIEDLVKKINEESLSSVISAMKGYIEKLILREQSDIAPFEAGITQLQEICRDLVNGKKFDKDVSPILINLNCTVEPPAVSSEPGESGDIKTEETLEEHEPAEATEEEKETPEEIQRTMSDEDKEIIVDFAAESLENLGTIEIKLMDLEQNPSDINIINDIFRPFHTVKGVSGFLNFNKINKLAHISENLLDKARNKELTIDGVVVDIILESVDLLKQMIENVEATLDSGTPLEGDINTTETAAKIDQFLNQTEEGGDKPLGEILVESGTVSKEDMKDALERQKKDKGAKIGEILVEEKKVKPKEVVSALRKQKRTAQPVALQVKVNTGKLDNIVDMVGELAIAQSMLRQNQLVVASKDRNLDQTINQLNLITSGLQKTAMSLRMVPIKNTFQKMLRLVRDLAKKAGKEVQLLLSGEDTEIDRNMVEEIYEPMVHMIRNSLDHGLEMPEERESVNKSRQGTVHIKAYYKGNDIVIEIDDDGRGLDREKILEKAITSGIVKEGENLTDGEINSLIFHAGLSTAEKITDISGRGVGMDVVRGRIVEKLRGKVDVQSTLGEGTSVFIRLPLTLAIIDGMFVKVANQRYIIPTLTIQESFKPKKSECHSVKGKGEVIMFRGDLIPLIRLDSLFGFNKNSSSNKANGPPWEKLVVVVENQEKRRCLLVDELLGQEEIVIKSLGGMLKDTKGVAGGAILGDGRIGLILDISGIFNIALEE